MSEYTVRRERRDKLVPICRTSHKFCKIAPISSRRSTGAFDPIAADQKSAGLTPPHFRSTATFPAFFHRRIVLPGHRVWLYQQIFH